MKNCALLFGCYFVLQSAACQPADQRFSAAEDSVATKSLPSGGAIHTDTFIQGDLIGGYADILFVVDNSGSMAEEQETLARSFQTFIEWLAQEKVSFHIGVTTTDLKAEGGRLVGSPKIIDNNTPNLVTVFSQNVSLGTNGSGTELGFEPAALALTEPLVSGDNAGFLRDNAKLFLVFVSDEDDFSEIMNASDLIETLAAAKGGDSSRVHYSAITGGIDGCESNNGHAFGAPRYDELITASGGLWGTICTEDFGVTLQELAFEVAKASGEYFLTQLPIVETIKVSVEGSEQTADRWTYHSETNSVQLNDEFIPEPGAEIVITYQVEGTSSQCDRALSSGEIVYSLDGGAESWKYFCIEIPDGAPSVVVHTFGGKGDPDLYMRHGDLPAGGDYDWRSVEPGVNETLHLSAPQAGILHIAVYGWGKYSDLSLQAIVY